MKSPPKIGSDGVAVVDCLSIPNEKKLAVVDDGGVAKILLPVVNESKFEVVVTDVEKRFENKGLEVVLVGVLDGMLTELVVGEPKMLIDVVEAAKILIEAVVDGAKMFVVLFVAKMLLPKKGVVVLVDNDENILVADEVVDLFKENGEHIVVGKLNEDVGLLKRKDEETRLLVVATDMAASLVDAGATKVAGCKIGDFERLRTSPDFVSSLGILLSV